MNIDAKNNFLIIAITLPYFFEGEAKLISAVLKNKTADLVHIRKPEASSHQIKSLITEINPNFHKRIKLHDHFELLDDFPLGGIHLNERNQTIHPMAKSVSRSFHTIEELISASKYDYVTLSPIFDSISKPGYKAAFKPDDLKSALSTLHNVIALGGVTSEKYPFLKEIGFHGAAGIGQFWDSNNLKKNNY